MSLTSSMSPSPIDLPPSIEIGPSCLETCVQKCLQDLPLLGAVDVIPKLDFTELVLHPKFITLTNPTSANTFADHLPQPSANQPSAHGTQVGAQVTPAQAKAWETVNWAGMDIKKELFNKISQGDRKFTWSGLPSQAVIVKPVSFGANQDTLLSKLLQRDLQNEANLGPPGMSFGPGGMPGAAGVLPSGLQPAMTLGYVRMPSHMQPWYPMLPTVGGAGTSPGDSIPRSLDRVDADIGTIDAAGLGGSAVESRMKQKNDKLAMQLELCDIQTDCPIIQRYTY